MIPRDGSTRTVARTAPVRRRYGILAWAAWSLWACDPADGGGGDGSGFDVQTWRLSDEPRASIGGAAGDLHQVYSGFVASDTVIVLGNSGTAELR
ncbi:MAG TPA: hypothetical protein VFQ76_08270, partial [Longimicrobiaceae bacterium]|nr:hypothetical protein [Longimicrobiaceae bacterium]